MNKFLKKLRACKEAVAWVEDRNLTTAWAECERGDWMLWLCGKMADKQGWPMRQQVVLAACACAETVLPIFENKYPDDKRPRNAIEAARKWACGKIDEKELHYAYAAADAAAYAYAADAYAAAYAYAADAAYAAYAAYAAAYAASRSAKQRKCADICRKMLAIPEHAEDI
jgi:hypothetical protein